MERFNKNEIIGITISIFVVVVVFAVAQFFSFNSIETESVFSGNTSTEAIVLPSDIEENLEQASTAVADGVSARGTITELIIQDVREGTGQGVVRGDVVQVHYIGVLENGTQFDNSYTRGVEFSFTVGEGEVIEGWDVGVLGMKEGGERILVIPADMAYGNRAVGPIPPNSPLLFAIELVEVE